MLITFLVFLTFMTSWRSLLCAKAFTVQWNFVATIKNLVVGKAKLFPRHRAHDENEREVKTRWSQHEQNGFLIVTFVWCRKINQCQVFSNSIDCFSKILIKLSRSGLSSWEEIRIVAKGNWLNDKTKSHNCQQRKRRWD